MSEKLQFKIGRKVPWVLTKSIRIPRVKYPVYREGKMSLPSPGRSLVLVAIYIFLFWLIAGGIYIYIREPISLGANSEGDPMWLYPSTHDAFIIESIVAAAIIFMGGLGFIFLYNTTKHSYNYPYAVKLMVIGLMLAGLSFGLLQWMISQKGG
jgi:OST3 / OST6 family, transporter family